MDRRRVDPVNVVERFAALDLVDVNEIRETLGLVNELFLERRQKHLFVELVGAAAHDFASGHQIHRRTDRDGRRQEGRFLRAFAHVFGNVVTAEAHADRINRRRDETFVNRPQYPVAMSPAKCARGKRLGRPPHPLKCATTPRQPHLTHSCISASA